MKTPCTVGILTFNNEVTLERALDSVKNFAEIIICDGGSTDRTLEIAKSYGCVILMQDECYKYPDNRIADFSGVRNQMLKAAKQEWFFYLDSDEYILDELSKEMLDIINDNDNRIFAYNVPRKYVLNGQIIEWASTYPNYHMRFFNKRHVKSFIKKVHERIDVLQDEPKGELRGCIYVPHESDLSKLRNKYDYYLKIQLEKLKGISFVVWLRVFYFHMRSIIGGIFKFMRGALFKKGTILPLNLELLKWNNNLKLIYQSFLCIRIFQCFRYKKVVVDK